MAQKGTACPLVAKPFLKWAGGKGQLLEIIRQHYPLALGKQITKYAEPFVGGGAVLFDLLSRFAFQEVFISDTNRELINTYLVVRDNVDQLILLLGQLQKEYITLDSVGRKKYYYKKRDEYNSISITSDFQQNINKAALFVFLNRTCYNGLYRVNSKNEFNVPAGAYKNPRICDQDNLRAVSQLLQGVTICCGYYTLSELFIDDKTFVYFDPPYRPLTKTASFTAYTEKAFDEEAQIALAHYIDRLTEVKKAYVLASNSDPKNSDPHDDFFDDLYQGYNIIRVNATRRINRNAYERGEVSELLISNY